MTNIEFLKEHIEQLKEALIVSREHEIPEMVESIETEIAYFKSILNDLEELEQLRRC